MVKFPTLPQTMGKYLKMGVRHVNVFEDLGLRMRIYKAQKVKREWRLHRLHHKKPSLGATTHALYCGDD